MKNKTQNLFSFKTLVLASLLLMSTALLFSCSKDKDNSSPSKSHKLVFKAIGSSDVELESVTYGYGPDNNMTSKTSLSGTTWTSEEITAPAGTIVAVIGATADGLSASSELTVQIYVDGALKKEGKGTGKTLTAAATYNF
ncbi:hypothetical protein SAMN05192529_11348 [Arachidicoccus rhizosphaerae]|uniref:Binding domain-containing protein, N-terminal n=1 Tax=Arachidicoccus rhizosphaerae TaxID=551991 RepID=A0A1H4A4K3_9BACT|nr:hypothetical protein [Arachidicoccus rhizosphaerae]SEA30708.1 hypothetical protein SAMN05192529_11348 [Arachidicoccus rhizosphaerae]